MWRLLAIRAGLLHSGGERVADNGAAVMEGGGAGERRNGSRQAQSGEGGKDQVLHRNSPIFRRAGMSGFDEREMDLHRQDGNAASQH